MSSHVHARTSNPYVIDALRLFLPRFLATRPALSKQQWRAVNAILHCRTQAMGGDVHACPDCSQLRFSWYSCNHKACPQCGRADTQAWVARQLEKLTGAPYFMVTFTLPQELARGRFPPLRSMHGHAPAAASPCALSQNIPGSLSKGSSRALRLYAHDVR